MLGRNGRTLLVNLGQANQNQDHCVLSAANWISKQQKSRRSVSRNNRQSTPKSSNRTATNAQERLNEVSRIQSQSFFHSSSYEPPKQTLEKAEIDSCRNHVHKQSKYVVVAGDQCLAYCQRCAIYLASQGFLVERLERGQSNAHEPRQKVVSELSADIREFVEILEGQKSLTDQQSPKWLCHIQQLKQRVHTDYRTIVNLAEAYRQRCLSHLQKQFHVLVQCQNQRQLECLRWLQECQQMQNDITEATESIRDANDEDFRQVVEFYQEKLADFSIQLRLADKQQATILNGLDRSIEVGELVGLFNKLTQELPQQPYDNQPHLSVISTIAKPANKPSQLESTDSLDCLLSDGQTQPSSIELSQPKALRA